MSRARIGRRALRDVAAEAAVAGWTWRRTGSGHIRWDHPMVGRPVFTPSTPRSGSGFKERQKLQTALRRAMDGVDASVRGQLIPTEGGR